MQESIDTRQTTKCKHLIMRLAKAVVCFVLCVSLVFGYSYKEPAHAGAVTAIAEFVLVSLCLSALGVTIGAAVGDKDSREYLNYVARSNEKLIKDGIDGCKYIGNGVVEVGSEVIEGIGNFVKDTWAKNAETEELRKKFPNGVDFINPTVNNLFFRNLFRPDPFDTYNFYESEVNKYAKLSIMGTITPYSDVHGWNGWQANSLRFGKSVEMSERCGFGNNASYNLKFSSNEVYKVNLFDLDGKSVCTVNSYVLAAYTDKSGKFGYVVFQPYQYIPIVHLTETAAFPADDSDSDRKDLQREKFYCSGKSIALNPPKDVVDEMKKKCGVVDPTTGKTSIPLNNTGSNEQLDNKTLSQTQQQTLNQDIATEADKAAAAEENAKNNNKERPKIPDLPDLALPELITKKFPFCIPFDIYVIVSGFYCDKAVAPHWEIPVKNPRLGWDWKIVLDWSQFEPVAVVCRWFNGAVWVFGLILVSRKLIGAGGGD